jgi:uncharacterized protein (DUF1501 family)
MRRRRATSEDPSRRDFFRTAACAALSTTSLVSTVWDLRMVNAATADKLSPRASSPGYKAMVCIFLGGGNDANNMVVPTDARYNDYSAVRSSTTDIGLPLNTLLQLNAIPRDSSPTPASSGYGLHPSMTGLQTLFNEGKVAVVTNVGTLVWPTFKATYGSTPKPPALLSHNDQVFQWQTSVPDVPSRTGWGGRCADLLNSLNKAPNAPVDATVSMSITLAGLNTFEVGNIVNAFTVNSSGGAATLNNLSTNQKTAFNDILVMGHPNRYENAFTTITDRAIDSSAVINAAIASVPNTWTVPFPNTNLGNQLKMIARLIRSRDYSGPEGAMNSRRQVFFASVGGYDTHDTQVVSGNTTTGNHANLLTELSNAMFAFQRAMEQLTIEDSVVTYTMSDFARTLKSTGLGSDHAWGSHAFVMGGQGADPATHLPLGNVDGGKVYGTFPTLVINGNDAIPESNPAGRWIPTTAVDQYAATIARWFGVTETDLLTVFPNVGRFATSNMGFMNLSVPQSRSGGILIPVQRAPLVP